MPEPVGSGPGYRRPVLIVQDDSFNESLINTVIVAIITGNLNIGSARGNVIVEPQQSGLAKTSVINVSQLFALDKSLFIERVEVLSQSKMEHVNQGLKLVLSLDGFRS